MVEPGMWSVDWPWLKSKHHSVVQSVLINIGTGFLIAAALAGMEPVFKKVVRETTSGAVAKVAEHFEGRVEDLEDAFDVLSRNLKTASEAQDHILAQALERPTHETVSALMLEAAEYGALAQDQITVQGTDRLGALVVTLALHYPPSNRLLEDDEAEPRLRIMGTTADGDATETWRASEGIEAPIQRLQVALTRQNAWRNSPELSWRNVTQRLLEGVGAGLRAATGQSGALPLEGRLGEIIVDGVFITDAGLECPEHGYVLERSEFVPLWAPDGFNWEKDPPIPDAERPAWLQAEVWTYALSRCSKRYTRRYLPNSLIVDDVLVPREKLGRESP